MTEHNDAVHSRDSGMAVLAVARGTQHAAKHVTNDALMFALVCNGLRDEGYDVALLPEDQLEQFLLGNEVPRRIVSMAQQPANVALLERLEENGSTVLNSTSGVVNCFRTNLVERLRGSDIPFAYSRVCDVDRLDFEELSSTLGSPFWVKRGDIHAAHPNDVILVRDEDQCRDVAEDFRARGITRLVVQSHLEGTVVKFYAVRGRRFFHVQDFESGNPVESVPEGLQETAEAVAEILGLAIFGGDAVLAQDGFALIDINAWPSFGSVREHAAPQMVREILAGLS